MPPALMSAPIDPAVDDRLERLEVKASYAEDLLDALNQVVADQQRELDALRRELQQLRAQLPTADGPAVRSLRDELPPHY